MRVDETRLTQIFGEIESELKNGQTLSISLQKTAQKFGLKKESVKNYYYRMIKLLRKDSILASKFQIDLSKFKNVTFEKFSKEEKVNLYNQVVKNLENGVSVRKTCMQLSNGDAKLTLRLQNKFRNMKSQIEKKDQKSSKESFNVHDSKKIIDFGLVREKMKSKISDSEINALFMGLVKIVKKSAIEHANSELKLECECVNQNYRKSIARVSNLERELEKEKQLNKNLNLKIEDQTKQICLLLEKLSDRKLKGLEKKSLKNELKIKNFKV